MSADLGLQHTAVRSEKDNIARKRAGRRSGEAQAPTDLRNRKVVVVIPAYNEERFIGSVVLKTCKHANVVLVVDDGSSDATAAIAREAGATVVRHEVNHGKGAALVTALKAARAHDPDVEQIKALIAQLNGE